MTVQNTPNKVNSLSKVKPLCPDLDVSTLNQLRYLCFSLAASKIRAQGASLWMSYDGGSPPSPSISVAATRLVQLLLQRRQQLNCCMDWRQTTWASRIDHETTVAMLLPKLLRLLVLWCLFALPVSICGKDIRAVPVICAPYICECWRVRRAIAICLCLVPVLGERAHCVLLLWGVGVVVAIGGSVRVLLTVVAGLYVKGACRRVADTLVVGTNTVLSIRCWSDRRWTRSKFRFEWSLAFCRRYAQVRKHIRRIILGT